MIRRLDLGSFGVCTAGGMFMGMLIYPSWWTAAIGACFGFYVAMANYLKGEPMSTSEAIAKLVKNRFKVSQSADKEWNDKYGFHIWAGKCVKDGVLDHIISYKDDSWYLVWPDGTEEKGDLDILVDKIISYEPERKIGYLDGH